MLMNIFQVTIAIVGPSLAVLLSIWITFLITEARIKRDRKERILRMLFESRYNVKGDDFLKAMNSIPLIFKDYPKVAELNRKLYNEIKLKKGTPPQVTELDKCLHSLLKQIIFELEISKEKITDDDIMEVFT